ncbi:MAG: GGDEF domain-containing protein [Lachnospiraceae bacterium]|jgi:diguanylate cyclase (GGDEF)-like protein|nr:GGDEF domain-containing protein [Lachnospiraceae bacterium]
MGERFYAFRKKCRSLSVRLPLGYVISGLFIMLLVIPFSYFRFQSIMVKDYTSMAQGLTGLMVRMLDGDKIQEYLEKNTELEEYVKLRRQLCEIKDSYPDVLFAHVLRFGEEGSYVIFNMQDSGNKAVGAPGDLVRMEKPYQQYLEGLIQGKEITIKTGKTEDGYLLTYFRPVFDSQGKYQCHICVAFSLAELRSKHFSFLFGMATYVTLAVLVVLLVDISLVRKRVIRPLEAMSNCVRNFTYDTEKERFRNVQAMEELNLQTHDEIEELYYEFMSVMKESLYYMTNLSRAKNNLQQQEEKIDQISETAYKDSLTSVGNPAAFNKLAEALNREIAEKTASFAIVMVDLNNLKYVNDTFGHKYGDSYIKGCCNIICSIYKRSPVFRVGGDEFVVVLRNEDYMSRLLRMTQIKEAFKTAHGKQDAQPWEKYSASVGMAEYEETDENVDQVLKRADKVMYENKLKFKEKYGSYR